MISSNPADPTQLAWRRSSFCDGGACVLVASSQGMVLVGDSKNPDGPTHRYTGAGWKNFITAIKNGGFDDRL